MSLVTVPESKDVRDVLVGLLFRDVTLTSGRPLKLDAGTTLAEYVDDLDRVVAVGVVDLSLAARGGAAIGLMPPGLANDCVRDKDLTPVLLDNVAEIFSVLASVFNHEGHPHVRRGQVYGPGHLPPVEVSELAQALMGRRDFSIEVAGYGSGKLALVVL